MTIGDAYESHDALGLAELVRRGEVRPDDLLEAAIERTQRLNPHLNAVVIPMFDEARRQLAADLPAGPFAGVPFLLKDLYADYAGVRLTYGSQLFADNVPDHDSELVARYKRAGLVIFGRSASPEFGITTSTESVLFGATRNPWNPERMAGGSSGGAAAAVAAGILPAAHASDGGGSIRIPASCCGLFGLKPTRARTPSGPDAGEGWSGMSTAHVVSRSVRDSAALLDATHGADPGAPYWAPPPARPWLDEVGASPGRLRIALQTRTFNGAPTHPDCVAAAEDAAKLCADLGHAVEPAELRIDAAAFARASQVIIASNLRATLVDRAAALGRELAAGDVEPLTYTMASAAAEVEAADYARAIRTIHGLGRQLAAFLERYDVLLSPTLATPPLPIGRLALTASDLPGFLDGLLQTVGYTQLFNATGTPAASLPLYWDGEGMPIGVQLAGRFGDEATLLRLSAQLEQARPWFERRPALA
jgi:Asp-tRNA(Asn)/Glu-tRNA(Gln) amidotransferase A subunit family amidase